MSIFTQHLQDVNPSNISRKLLGGKTGILIRYQLELPVQIKKKRTVAKHTENASLSMQGDFYSNFPISAPVVQKQPLTFYIPVAFFCTFSVKASTCCIPASPKGFLQVSG